MDEEYFQHHPGKEKQPKSFPFDLYVNGFPRFLTKIKLIRNESYVNLRELCAALGVQVRFRNDDYHMPMISGREPNGILMNTSATLKIVKLPDYRTGTADSYFGPGGTFDRKLFVDITPQTIEVFDFFAD
ncbi:MAG: hypothetical protein Q4A52_05115 [Bacillota bacterium]|nr:hypothetical protein [Bacillota bacterium]